jgi:hypothetical protein
MAVKYTNIFHSKSLQNLPKLRVWVWKYTIWQHCCKNKPLDISPDNIARKSANSTFIFGGKRWMKLCHVIVSHCWTFSTEIECCSRFEKGGPEISFEKSCRKKFDFRVCLCDQNCFEKDPNLPKMTNDLFKIFSHSSHSSHVPYNNYFKNGKNYDICIGSLFR